MQQSSHHFKKSHNVTLLLYHIVLPAKYRRHVFSKGVFDTLLTTCMQIEQAYEIRFLEIGNDEDNVHFMIQGIPTMSITSIVQIIKSITTRQIYALHRKEITRQIWTGKLRTSGYYVNTVGAFVGEKTIRNYIKNQGFSKYQVLYEKNLKQGLVPLFPVPRS